MEGRDGFTEADQTRIAEAAQAHRGLGRTGLGFGARSSARPGAGQRGPESGSDRVRERDEEDKTGCSHKRRKRWDEAPKELSAAAMKGMAPKDRLKAATRANFAEISQGPGSGTSNRVDAAAAAAAAANFFASDEMAALGAAAGISSTNRQATLAAVRDEHSQSIEEVIGRKMNEVKQDQGFEQQRLVKEIAHHDAVFAPTRPVVPSAVRGNQDGRQMEHSSIERPKWEKGGAEGVEGISYYKSNPAPVRDDPAASKSSVGGRAISDRTQEKNMSKNQRQRTKDSSRRRQSDDEDVSDSDKPLYEVLQIGDIVEAQYTEDNIWYTAEITQVIHKGYRIAKYKVLYQNYGNSETIGWDRIRILKTPQKMRTTQQAASSKKPDEPEHHEQVISQSTNSSTRANSLAVGGFAPRAIRHGTAPKQSTAGGDIAPAAAAAATTVTVPDTVEELAGPRTLALLGKGKGSTKAAAAAANKPSWRDKVAQRKRQAQKQ